jgi:hypothetical protein
MSRGIGAGHFEVKNSLRVWEERIVAATANAERLRTHGAGDPVGNYAGYGGR